MSISTRVCHHLRSEGYPSNVSARFASLMQKWVSCSGKEWTVSRLKSAKQAYLDSLSKDVYVIPEGWSTRRNRKGQTIIRDGFIHSLISSRSSDPLKIGKTLGFFRISDVLILRDPSKKQVEKMMKAITSPRKPSADSDYVDSVFDKISEILDQSAKSSAWERLSERTLALKGTARVLPNFLQFGGSKRSPVVIDESHGIGKPDIRLTSMTRDSHKCLDFTYEVMSDHGIASLTERHPAEVGRCLLGIDRMPIVPDMPKYRVSIPAGKVSIIQDVACKARWIANPTLTIQALGEPLKVALAELSKALPFIATFDQDRGRDVVLGYLKSGRRTWSYDQSSFTDRFPVDFQLRVLDKLKAVGPISQFDYDLFEMVVQKEWSFSGERIKWTVGQPLGFGPSFHLATLTHGLAALAIGRLSGVSKPHELFTVVGDDIVIADEEMAMGYERFISALGMDINVDKTMVSSKFAQYLGRVISYEGIPKSLKVRELKTQDSLVSAMLYYGKQGLPGLSSIQKRMAAKCYYPDYLGGCGWRLDGIKYPEWINSLNLDVLKDRAMLKELTSFTGQFPDARVIGRYVEEKSMFYHSYVPSLSVAEWEMLGVNTPVNELTNLPVRKDSVVEDSTVVNNNTFVFLVDTMLREEMQQLFPSAHTKSRYFGPGSGYISDKEKPYTGQSYQLGENDDSKSTRPNQVFNELGIERFLREADGISRDEFSSETGRQFKGSIDEEGKSQIEEDEREEDSSRPSI